MFLFIFSDDKGMKEVYDNGPCLILKQHIILKIWTKKFDFKREEFVTLSIWVNLYGILTGRERALTQLLASLGRPLFVDEAISNANYLYFARICVDMKAGSNFPSFF